MSFLSPIWLIALIPWLGVVVWLLRGQRRRTAVPFLPLWRGPVSTRPKRRQLRFPPVAVMLGLLAALLAVLAAAGPLLPSQAGGAGQLSIVLDRGVTMSAGDPPGAAGVTAAIDALDEHLRDSPSALTVDWVDLVVVPGGTIHRTTMRQWASLARAQPPTAVETGEALAAVLRERLERTDGPILLLSDRLGSDEATERRSDEGMGSGSSFPSSLSLPVADRVIQITPHRPLENVGLVGLAVRDRPHAQAMLRVRNDSDLVRAMVRVETGEHSSRHAIELPRRGTTRDYFVNLPPPQAVVRVELEVDDDLDVDNRAWLVRRRPWPRIEPRGDLPAEVRRLVKVHQATRPAGPGSATVRVVDDPQAVSAHDAAVVVLRPGAGGALDEIRSRQGSRFEVQGSGYDRRHEGEESPTLRAFVPDAFVPSDSGFGDSRVWQVAMDSPEQEAAMQVTDHPVTGYVDWEAASGLIRPGRPAAGPPAGFEALVHVDAHVLVAAREEPARQVWVGFDAGDWSRTADFVVFWANVLEWAGRAEEGFGHQPVQRLGEEWSAVEAPGMSGDLEPGYWPGLYRRGDGALVAVNALDVPVGTAETQDWRERLREVTGAGAVRDVSSWAALSAAGLVVSALIFWPRREIRPAPGPAP